MSCAVRPNALACSLGERPRVPVVCSSTRRDGAAQPGSRRRASPTGACLARLGQQLHGQRAAAAASSRQPASSSSVSGSSHAAAAGGPAAGTASTVACASPVLLTPQGSNNIVSLNEHRRGVGLCIYRADGLVFAARRMDDTAQSWQMPQGGIDRLENPRNAALRELHEETGITSCRIVASIDPWLTYTFPTKVKAEACPHGSFLKYRGQTQKWFLLEFLGADSEIDLTCHGHPEFSEYSWQPLEALPAGVVDFKQAVYAQVAQHFAPEIKRRVGAARCV